MKKITKNSNETKKLGNEFPKKIKGGDVLLLYGNLGAGKTTFVQGFAEGLGITERILSPTFVLQRIHEVHGSNIKNLNHIDLYRLENPTEIENLGLGEMFDDSDSVTVIEWADRLLNFSPKKGFKIYFKYLDDDKREIVIKEI